MLTTADEKDEIRSGAREFLADRDNHAWERLVELDWPGIAVPEELGGVGLGPEELVIVMSELGRALVPGPLISALAMAPACLLSLPPSSARDNLLRQMGAGKARTLVLVGDSWLPHDIDAQIRADRTYSLRGVVGVTPGVDECTAALVRARSSDGSEMLVGIDLPATGLEAKPVALVDESRSGFVLQFDDVMVSPQRILCEGDDVKRAAERAHSWGCLAVAADSLGVAQHALALTLAYAGTRTQFGRPVGSFQAVKHGCTNMFVRVSSAEVLLRKAAHAVAAAEDNALELAWMAKSVIGESCAEVCAAAIQLHGGIGYTWEHPIHRYMKRAKLNQTLLGSSRTHRGAVLDSVLSAI